MPDHILLIQPFQASIIESQSNFLSVCFNTLVKNCVYFLRFCGHEYKRWFRDICQLQYDVLTTRWCNNNVHNSGWFFIFCYFEIKHHKFSVAEGRQNIFWHHLHLLFVRKSDRKEHVQQEMLEILLYKFYKHFYSTLIFRDWKYTLCSKVNLYTW